MMIRLMRRELRGGERIDYDLPAQVMALYGRAVVAVASLGPVLPEVPA